MGGGAVVSKAHRGWSTFLPLYSGTPRLLWCRYPEAARTCVSPWAALFAARAAAVRRRNEILSGSFQSAEQRKACFLNQNVDANLEKYIFSVDK